MTAIRIFTYQWKLAWLATLALTTAVEITPFDSSGVPPVWFYSYQGAKCFAFIVLGCETSVAFQSWASSSVALLLGLLSAGSVEALQFLSSGHRFSVVELLAKLLMVYGGFALGLAAVHDGQVGFLKFHAGLVWGSSRGRRGL